MIRSGYALFPSLLFMTGCPAGKPGQDLVRQIEVRLAANSCLSTIAQMRRTYSYARRGWKIDPNRIDIEVREAGFDGLPGGIFITEPPSTVTVDDRERFGAYATYAISADALDLWSCGETRSGIRHNPRY